MTVPELISNLEERLGDLEYIVSETPLDPHQIIPKETPQATILGGFKQAQQAYERILDNHPDLKSFMQQC